MTQPTDVRLLKRSWAGDPEAFVQLVKRHEQPVAGSQTLGHE